MRYLALSALILVATVGAAQAQNCEAIEARKRAMAMQCGFTCDIAGMKMLEQQYYACLAGQGQSHPLYQQPYQPQQPQMNALQRAIASELEFMGKIVMKGQPLRQDIPLSAGTVQMQMVRAPDPAPVGYADPFAVRTFAPVTQSNAGPVKSGNIWDPNQWVQLQPTQPNSNSPTSTWKSDTFVNPKGCTFNSPDCR